MTFSVTSARSQTSKSNPISTARAECVSQGRQQAVVRCDVFVVKDGEEKLCAVAQGTIARLGEAA